jgi:predicted RNA-binding protein YlxR (DUF448 family)
MKPIRMCISCRGRFEQNRLTRFQCKDKKLSLFTGVGRSMYLCKNCIEDTNKLSKSLKRACKNNKKYEIDLKEILVNVR